MYENEQKRVFIKITGKGLKLAKKVENGWKKVVQPAFRCAQHPKAG